MNSIKHLLLHPLKYTGDVGFTWLREWGINYTAYWVCTSGRQLSHPASSSGRWLLTSIVIVNSRTDIEIIKLLFMHRTLIRFCAWDFLPSLYEIAGAWTETWALLKEERDSCEPHSTSSTGLAGESGVESRTTSCLWKLSGSPWQQYCDKMASSRENRKYIMNTSNISNHDLKGLTP